MNSTSFKFSTHSGTCVGDIGLKLQNRYLASSFIMGNEEDSSQAKGQLISKGIFGVFNSPKKRTKNVCPRAKIRIFKFVDGEN